jgi:hypothetical protein
LTTADAITNILAEVPDIRPPGESPGRFLPFNAYVASKYKKGDEYFLDLIWWDETLDNYLVQEGVATIKLPKK